MKRKGGKRTGAGRDYRPHARIWLADRYAELLWKFRDAGVSNAGEMALETLHAESGRSLEATWRLIVRGRHDEIFLDELDAKRHNREPLTDFELSVLHGFSRRWARLLRHKH